jgi:regulator of sirC expression with transglutaminase-like and TPR domain
MEYFKNVVLKLYETGEAESLLPVLAQLLQLSPAEVAHCRDALHARSEQLGATNAASGEALAGDMAGYLGGWTGWIGGGR